VTWPDAEVFVDEALVRDLLTGQFPEFRESSLTLVGEGFDNYLWRIGERHVARLPRRALALGPLESELRWLEIATRAVTLATPCPVLQGSPTPRYAWPWMIASWIEGTSGDEVGDDALFDSATALATFLGQLHTEAPPDAPRNPWRSIPLAERSSGLEARLEDLRGELDVASAWALFQRSREAPPWNRPAVWLHGDFHPGNTVFLDGRLAGVVDFGDLCAGDPATDLAGALLSVPYGALETFLAGYGDVDGPTLERTIGWAVVFGTMMVSLGRSVRPRYTRVGRRGIENAARLSREHL
jgi:aminoglycoside phosphotransferase (APT) family kinase protein